MAFGAARNAPKVEIVYTIQELFEKFSKYGDTKSDGKTITLSASDRWMKQAGIFGKKLTTTDTGIAFNKYKSRTVNYADWEKFLQDLAKTKNLDYYEMTTKLTNCGLPGQGQKDGVFNLLFKLKDIEKIINLKILGSQPCLA